MERPHKSQAPERRSGRPGIDGFTQGYVRKRARQLAGQFGFTGRDCDEIEQRLYLKLATRLGRADPDDPRWKAFVAKTVRRHVASMIRDRLARKRDHRRVCSIHVVVGADEYGPIELADMIGEQQGRAHRSCFPRGRLELTELSLDVAACVARLHDPRLREFCERLQHDSITRISRDMNIPRTTLNWWRRILMQRFEEQGLKNYL